MARISVLLLLEKFQLKSTRYTDAGVKHLKVRINLSQTDTKIYYTYNSHSDLSPDLVRSAVKSCLRPWLTQNLSRHGLNKLTVFTSTTWLDKLFQILTMCAVK